MQDATAPSRSSNGGGSVDPDTRMQSPQDRKIVYLMLGVRCRMMHMYMYMVMCCVHKVKNTPDAAAPSFPNLSYSWPYQARLVPASHQLGPRHSQTRYSAGHRRQLVEEPWKG
jgi:hypothetical protein